MIELNLDGYTELPAGKIASVVTYLELRERPHRRAKPRDELRLERVEPVSPDWYRTLYRRIGERWMWFSRLTLSDENLGATLNDPRTLVWKVMQADREIGLIELDLRPLPSIELAFFGLVPEALGDGIGSWMMDEALAKAFAQGPERVFVHTCTLDHPNALPFYMSCGFKPYGRALEIVDDPRLDGTLPKAAAPQLPIL